MQIILIQDEIVEAILTHVRSQINITENQEIAIELKAGRGDNGYTATLDIRQIPLVTATTKHKTKVTTVQEGGPLNIVTKPPVVVAAAAAPTKLFGAKEKTSEPVVEAEPTKAGISSGEDRGEAEDAITEETVPEAETQEVTTADETAAEPEKPKSIFSFNKAKEA